ncbi:hypothetical protein DPMN_120230 [Dreissena polymorpha]|uniref:Uncharacterized protein n=1 Tax=Dreissena polymorpha TaxID=45954 RepID=A0A9D4JPZ0_DREPO|nr:hypothetical protein DPMN_120230 [Dreissena polymorpha]
MTGGIFYTDSVKSSIQREDADPDAVEYVKNVVTYRRRLVVTGNICFTGYDDVFTFV